MLLDPPSSDATLEGDGAAAPLFEPAPASDDDRALLDAYSAAVASAVELVAPAVVHLRVAARRGRAARPSGAGSGFLITPDGYLLTNSHVAGGATAVEVTLADGRHAAAEIGRGTESTR